MKSLAALLLCLALSGCTIQQTRIGFAVGVAADYGTTESFDVSPGFSDNYLAHGRLRNGKEASYYALVNSSVGKRTNGDNILGCDPSGANVFSPGRLFWVGKLPVVRSACHLLGGGLPDGPPLGGTVSHVVGLGAEKQMIWPHARRIVAFVKNAETVGDWSPKHEVRESVGVYLFRDTNTSVSYAIAPSRPKPASTRDVDLCHESSEKCRVGAGEWRGCYDGISHGRSSNQGPVVRSEVSARNASSGRLNYSTERTAG